MARAGGGARWRRARGLGGGRHRRRCSLRRPVLPHPGSSKLTREHERDVDVIHMARQGGKAVRGCRPFPRIGPALWRRGGAAVARPGGGRSAARRQGSTVRLRQRQLKLNAQGRRSILPPHLIIAAVGVGRTRGAGRAGRAGRRVWRAGCRRRAGRRAGRRRRAGRHRPAVHISGPVAVLAGVVEQQPRAGAGSRGRVGGGGHQRCSGG